MRICVNIHIFIYPLVQHLPIQLPVVNMRSYNEKNDSAEQGDGGIQDTFVGHLGAVQGAFKEVWVFGV